MELFKTEYYIDEMSVQKYPSLVVMSDFDRMDCWWKGVFKMLQQTFKMLENDIV